MKGQVAVALAPGRNPRREEFTAALPELYVRARRTCSRILYEDADAEDAVQQALLLAWKSIDDFRADASWSTWINRIATNAALDILRRKKRKPEHQFAEALSAEGEFIGYQEDLLPDPALDPSVAFLQSELNERLYHLIGRSLKNAPEYYAPAFILHYGDGLGHAEISKMLSIPENTLKVAVYRAMEMVRKAIARRGASALRSSF